MRPIALAVVAAALALAPPLHAQEAGPAALPAELAAKLKRGGYNIFFRHALTPNHKDALDRDPDDPRHTDCSHQRNLSAEGIEQSREIGEAFRVLEIPVGMVRSSPMCRSMDTAWYAFGFYVRDRNVLLHGTNPGNDPAEAKIFKTIQNLARIPPLPMTNTVFLSHGTVGEVFGVGYLDEGEAVIVQPDGRGGYSAVARVKSGDWQ